MEGLAEVEAGGGRGRPFSHAVHRPTAVGARALTEAGRSARSRRDPGDGAAPSARVVRRHAHHATRRRRAGPAAGEKDAAMRAAGIHQFGANVELLELPEPESPAPDEVLIRLVA